MADFPPRIQAQILAQLSGGKKTAGVTQPAPVRNSKHQPNKTEERFAKEVLRGLEPGYESVTFRLPGGSRYTPDFTLWTADGQLHCFEVKGGWRLPSHGRALVAFRESRKAFPHVEFHWFRRTEDGFEENYLEHGHRRWEGEPDEHQAF